jgi:hypothetical protein
MVLISLLCKRVFVLSRGMRPTKKVEKESSRNELRAAEIQEMGGSKKERRRWCSPYERGKALFCSDTLLAALFV